MNASVDDALFKEAQKAFKKMGLDVGKAMEKSIKKGGNIVAKEARANAPRLTGKGKKSIRARKKKKKRDEAPTVTVSPSPENMHMVFPEFGTPSQNRQWFTHNALETKSQEVILSIESDLKKVINNDV